MLFESYHAKHVIFSGVPFDNKKWMAAAARIERGTSGDHAAAAAAAAALRRKRPRERNDGMAAMAAQRQDQKERGGRQARRRVKQGLPRVCGILSNWIYVQICYFVPPGGGFAGEK